LTIRVNGEPFEIAGPVTISALLAELKIDPRRVAVEHNFAIVKRDRYGSVVVSAGDEIEIVNFVGGGNGVDGGNGTGVTTEERRNGESETMRS
jgi:thiamine biosynthesis protein ThiS